MDANRDSCKRVCAPRSARRFNSNGTSHARRLGMACSTQLIPERTLIFCKRAAKRSNSFSPGQASLLRLPGFYPVVKRKIRQSFTAAPPGADLRACRPRHWLMPYVKVLEYNVVRVDETPVKCSHWARRKLIWLTSGQCLDHHRADQRGSLRLQPTPVGGVCAQLPK
jgi:hypothetical protein